MKDDQIIKDVKYWFRWVADVMGARINGSLRGIFRALFYMEKFFREEIILLLVNV